MFGAADSQPDNAQPDANGVFADVFDEVLFLSYPRDSVIRPSLVTATRSREIRALVELVGHSMWRGTWIYCSQCSWHDARCLCR